MSESKLIELNNLILDLDPYILIEVTGAEDVSENEIDLTLNLQYGGGLTADTVVELLEAALEKMKESPIG